MSFPAKAHPNVLAGSRTLVIGGTSGLGAAVVSGTLSSGGLVHIASSSASKIATKISEFHSLYPSAVAVTGTAADLSNPATLDGAIETILREAVAALGGPLDHIVYTAGEAFKIPALATMDPTTYFAGWTVRLLGPVTVGKHVAARPGEYLKVAPTSSVTLTSGVLTRRPRPGISALVPVAGATETFARALALDLAPVRVNVVLAGAVHTELLARFGDEAMERSAQATLTKHIGRPEDAAEAYLMSMRSSFTTGQDFVVDGGAVYL